jgi:hypothetical protein
MPEKKIPGYSCKPRNLRFTDSEVESGRSLGSNCYRGSPIGDICNDTGELCEVICGYRIAHEQKPKESPNLALTLDTATRNLMSTSEFMRNCQRLQPLR